MSKEDAKKLEGTDFELMTSADLSSERLTRLIQLFGEEKANWLNFKIETDFILKKQKETLINWINEKRDVSKKYRDDIIRRIVELEKPLIERDMDMFIEELTELSLEFGVTLEEEERIVNLCKKVDEAKNAMENGGSEENYKIACKDRDDYIEKLKNQ
ncbi:MAG TPA: hypothetical protein PKN54_05915 [Candidatus Cloacimonas acidaminovorans]|nr:hypothetical protein [Candidatus Cloacimonas acidaminovorans]